MKLELKGRRRIRMKKEVEKAEKEQGEEEEVQAYEGTWSRLMAGSL